MFIPAFEIQNTVFPPIRLLQFRLRQFGSSGSGGVGGCEGPGRIRSRGPDQAGSAAPAARPVEFSLLPRKDRPVIILTDASYSRNGGGRLGVVVIDPHTERIHYASGQVPAVGMTLDFC